MAVGDNRVYGLKLVIELVRAFMTREERDGSLHSRHFPVLVVEGFHGSGKTALLSALANRLDQRVPHVKLDLETNRHASVPQLLSAIAFDLSRKYPQYDSLQFPRFIIGQLVMRLELDLSDHSRAYQQVVEALKHHRGFDTVRQVLVETAGSVLLNMGRNAGVPVEPPSRLLEAALDWLSDRVTGRRLVLGSFQNWYGHRDLGLLNDPIDMLVDLNRRATDYADEENQRRIDDLLWAAFLADLRAAFGRGRRADERSLNCVVLLDNADTALGRRFLHQLVRARRQRAAGDQDDADPLTVVATSRGALLADVPEADQALVTQEDLRAGPLPQHVDWPRCWWLRYRLSDLTEDEVGRAVIDMTLDWGDNQRLPRILYGLTGGHPASTRLMLDAIAKSSPKKWFDPEAVLAQVEPDDQRSVEEQLLGSLLADATDAELRDLATCAAARKRAHALLLAGQDDLLLSGRAGYEEALDPILWPADGSAGLTLLRRLAGRRLARRDPALEPSWSDVHARLRVACRAEGDEAGDLYHALADDELGFVARRLHERLLELDAETWFHLLASVTEAPHRQRQPEAPIDEVRTLVGSAGLEQPLIPVGSLVAALRIVADPCTDSRRRALHLQIADDYSAVSRLCPGGPHAVFLEAARRHRREAEWWD
ncbi:hypothetical protein [Amycolatopsis nigrescens]|uniref:hypothetical protein n=1 Tax=Amycolatopsis nigrescens TaxID=381445 RepID=UPI00037A3D0A|nr:hypothetical protein [Amycolatopsis nigrescens]